MNTRRTKLLTLSIMTALLLSCSTNTGNETSIQTINITSSNEVKDVQFSDYFERYKFVPLETTEQSFIGRIDKLEITENIIYILTNNTLKIFDNNGKFLNSIDKKGRANNEYISLGDFIIDENADNVILVDNSSIKALKYSFDGEFIESVELPRGATFQTNGSGNYLVAKRTGSADGKSESYQYSVADPSGNEIMQYLPYNKHLTGYGFINGQGKSDFIRDGKDLLLHPTYSDTLYKIAPQNGSPKAYMAISINNTERPQTHWNHAKTDKFRIDRGNTKIPSTLFSIYKKDDLIFGQYVFDLKFYSTLIEDNIIKYNSTEMLADSDGLPVLAVSYTDNYNSGLVSSLSPISILNNTSEATAKLRTTLTEDSNPVLVLYRAKKEMKNQ